MYEYYKEEGDYPLFTFTTDNDFTYYVAFRDMEQEGYPLENLYAIDFYKIEKGKTQKDKKVSLTILQIIFDFIAKNESLIIYYLCDSMDNKQTYREKLFSKWFAISDTQNWNKFDLTLENHEDYKMSFLYNSNIYSNEIIESEVIKCMNVLERSKH